LVRFNSFIGLSLGLAIIGVLTLGLPHLSQAATYAYVNTSGTVLNVTANTSAGAIATAPNIGMHSGVMLIDNTNYSYNAPTAPATGGALSGYLYVNSSGQVVHVNSDTSAEAFADANNIATHSGVMIIDSFADGQMINDQVTVR